MPTVPPIDPTISAVGPEWQIDSSGASGASGQPADQAQASSGGTDFGGMLSNAISSLDSQQTQAANAAQSLVDGSATDPTSVVMSVERANLAMQLASQVRNKAVEATQEIFHTQV